MGRISSVSTQAKGSSGTTTVASGPIYQPFGGVTGAKLGNGVSLTVGRDGDGRLTSINSGNGSASIQNLGYGYDLASNITSITDNLTSARSQTFTYDDLNRLNSASGLYG